MTTSRRILVGVAVGVVLAAVAIMLLIPHDQTVERVTAQSPTPDAAVAVRLSIDNVDANRGVMTGRLRVAPGPDIPTSGATLFTNLDGVAAVQVRPGDAAVNQLVTLDFTSGSIANYPFDEYSTPVRVSAVEGADAALAEAETATPLPVKFAAVATPGLFEFGADATRPGDSLLVDISLQRTRSAFWWAAAMMGLYWLLASAAIGVTLAVVLRARPWETRHLAWLGAMVFALAAFRNVAPGQPPIGVFFDRASFFWAIAIVTFSLVALVVHYLSRSREDLEL